MPSLDWAASRFELGADRGSMIEALSDYLLAMRGLLEGGGAARTTMSARVAALACAPHEREQVFPMVYPCFAPGLVGCKRAWPADQ